MRFDRVVLRDIGTHASDYALAAGMVSIAVVALVTRIDVQDADADRFTPDTWWGWTATLAACAMLIGRRRWPLRTLTFALVLTLPLEVAHQRDTVAFFAVVIAVFSVAANLPLKLAGRALALVAVFYAVLAINGTIVLLAVPILGPIFLAAAFALGLMIQRGRTLDGRDAQTAINTAAAAIETAEFEAAADRLRMAQELHDVVAHSLSVIAVQAGIGVHLIDRKPIEASRALDAIRTTCDTTKIELDRLVGILRDGTAYDTTSAPTISMVAALVEQIRRAGQPVTLITDGDLTIVPSGASLAAYRIVQEALTNVVRHAGSSTTAIVTIHAGADGIKLTIDDDGRGLGPDETGTRSGGHGLIGMAERARMYGGDVQSGPRPGGGFRVRATLDFQADASPASPAPPSTERPEHDDQTPSRRWLSPSLSDTTLAALMAVISTLEVIATDPSANGPQFTPTHAWAFGLRLASSATLAFRRRHPTIAYTAAWVLGLALTIGDYQVGVMIFVLWIGLYSVATYAPRRQLIGAVIGTTLGIMIVAWSRPPDLTGPGAVWAGVFFAASAVAGYAVRRERDHRNADLELRRQAAADTARHTRLTLISERLRIADELSTIITGSISTIARHADVGSLSVANETSTAREALQTISTISRDALNDLRRLLRHMRTTGPTIYSPILAIDQPTATDPAVVP